MADENIIPSRSGAATPQIEVLFAGYIADDDLMWLVRCSVEEFQNLMQTPVAWVAALGDLPGWHYPGGEKAPAPVLTRDFVLLASPTDVRDPDDWVTVQGISDTNQLSVVASRESAALAAKEALGNGSTDNAFTPFWEEIARDPAKPGAKKPLLVTAVPASSRFYAHFEILNPGETKREQALRTAAFVLATPLDPEGYVAMLNGLDQRTLYVGPESTEPGPAIKILPKISNLVYANVEAPTNAKTDSPPQNSAIVCNMADGPLHYEQGTGAATGTIVKYYGVES